MKLDLDIDDELYKRPEDKSNDSWDWSGSRCSLCKEDFGVRERYYAADIKKHNLMECLEVFRQRIEKLEDIITTRGINASG